MSVFDGPRALAEAAAGLFVESVSAASGARVAVGLSGGSTPQALYQVLATTPFSERVPWSRMEFYWSDERCVPPEHLDSNYGMAWRALLSRVRVRPEQAHRIPGELDPKEAARLYDIELRKIPAGRLDLLLLGVGTDGHMASIFPGSPALEERTAWAAPAAAQDSSTRVTLTLPFINRSRRVFILASGAAKRDVVRRALRDPSAALPIQRVAPPEPPTWLLDLAAAGRVRPQNANLIWH